MIMSFICSKISMNKLCGNGTRTALSHGEPVWEDTRNMEQEANCLYCDCQTMGTADVAATARTHRVCCPLLVKRRTLPPQTLTKFRIRRPLIHRADLCYQVCGNGTRTALSHGEPVWEDTRNMEQEANCLYCDCQTISTKIVRTLFV